MDNYYDSRLIIHTGEMFVQEVEKCKKMRRPISHRQTHDANNSIDAINGDTTSRGGGAITDLTSGGGGVRVD